MHGETVIQLGRPADRGPLVVTCEHAGNAIPAPLVVAPDDRPWLRTHWGVDIGAADVVRALVARTRSVGVMAMFSRLVCDANRAWDDPTCIRAEVEGHELSFNRDIGADERARRRGAYYDPYHDAVDALLSERLAVDDEVWLLAVHSFSPVVGDHVREMQVGVLYDAYEPMALELAEALRRAGFVTALNEPYSGIKGEIYSVTRHGTAHGLPYLELEIRQDLIDTPAKAKTLAGRLAPLLQVLASEGG